MGSDNAPGAEIAGALEAARATDISLLLVGDEQEIRKRLAAHPEAAVGGRIDVVHAEEVIEMDDHPAIAVKQKKRSSMRVCFDLAKSKEVDAVVSAGNSGAMMACGLFVLGRLPGVDRPAIVTTFPTTQGRCALLDMGANVDPKPQVLAQFAVLGSVYSRVHHGKQRPLVSVLSNGAEAHKGTALTRETHKLLGRANAGTASFAYGGYVEGGDIFRGHSDVVVTDGFTGNVLLKGGEGVVEIMYGTAREEILKSNFLVRLGAWLMKPALRRLAKKTDYAETGGAPLMGVDGVVMICHGSSDNRAIKNAILEAQKFASAHLREEVASEIKKHSYVWQPDSRQAGCDPMAQEQTS